MKFSWSIICLLAVVVVFTSCSNDDGEQPYPKATSLYFSDFGGKKVGVVDLNNLNTATTIMDETDGLDTVAGIAIDFVNGKVYAAEELKHRIVRFNLDGSGALDVLYELSNGDSSVYEPTAVTFDPETNDLYWANSGTGRLSKGSQDGSASVNEMYDSAEVLTYSYGMAWNNETKGFFFSDFGQYAGVYYVNPLGNMTTTRPSRLFAQSYLLRNPSQIFFDDRSQNVYWADETLNTLAVGNGQSLAYQMIYDDEDNITRPAGIAVDLGSGKIYWTEPTNKVIKRANIDGTGDVEVVLTGVESYHIVLRFDNQ
ncbi:NHL repeat-containing protein [Pseudochryseolinea flava]|uniref:DUF5050 domain-containing protein n=1 Tax=Pseudochryseolinea flava TaxID=2059302 RepID=A0A364Y8S9_9BACT|nr:hypothetical protein [Pseudochryseolinea flava]RAW02769.1 hypothetical protein DQQ10_01280 [Pseudochryseolinea flava]